MDLGLLRSILVGSVRLQKRLYEASLADSPTCPFCHCADETLAHCFWECSHWQHIRADYSLPGAEVRREWPACTRECGIFVEDQAVIALSCSLINEEAVLQNFMNYFELPRCRAAVSASEPNT